MRAHIGLQKQYFYVFTTFTDQYVALCIPIFKNVTGKFEECVLKTSQKFSSLEELFRGENWKF